MLEIAFTLQRPERQKKEIQHVLFEQLKRTFPQKISGYKRAVKINYEINSLVIRTSIHHNTSLKSCTYSSRQEYCLPVRDLSGK